MRFKRIHFVGIKGVGMSPLALIAKEAGATVTGSDVAGDFITKPALDKAGIVPYVGFAKEHVDSVDLVITTGAHGGFENIEVTTARENNIPVWSHGEALGKYLSGDFFGEKFQGIAISGTHGKTTTTALIATILTEHGYDPSYIIGTSSVSTLPQPGHHGKGKYFVVEADEYATDPVHDKKARFLWLYPDITVITNIEHDHPDIYPTLDSVRDTFLAFTKQLQPNGVLVVYGDDPQIQLLLKEYNGRVITYGFSSRNDYVVKNVSVATDYTHFELSSHGKNIGEFATGLVGEHNVLNSVAALIVGQEVGLSLANIKESLMKFSGTKRRFEFIGTLSSGAMLYDDYAHHPTEIKKTLQAASMLYPDKKIVPIFQPHTYTRTRELFNEFTYSFSHADTVILTDIYASLRETPDPAVSVQTLAQEMKKQNISVIHLPNLSDVVEYLKKSQYGSDTVLITMGAGDVYTIREHLPLSKDG